MNRWKVILAILVLFCSGLAVGVLIERKSMLTAKASNSVREAPAQPPLPLWSQQQKEFVRRIDRALTLTPAQRENIENILHESHDRTRAIREKIAPEMRDEIKRVREQIRAELTPEQKKGFEEAMKAKIPRKVEDAVDERRKREGFRRQRTNDFPTEGSTPSR